ncbi:UNKNOWN [Stylonychia lemnae]|uniref:Uncharacterized protein n=1 Tax=Stylonychia lemnae TaxID=5949 RepID=A0A077ZWL8_STYLE|nr:UNKNOWN [Stylonychia lemnae]|eukprot:CDW73682.1 UNKNOWN [Stylonychia lemnae]
MNSNDGGTQRTAQNTQFNNTGRNWRKLITPAQDSLNKFQQQQQDYSGYNPGSRVNTQNDKQNGATTNSQNTSMDTSNLSLSVKQFTPSQDVKQLKMTLKGGISNTTESNHKLSMNSEINNFGNQKLSHFSNNNHLETIHDEESKNIKSSLMYNDNFGASTSQMKSIMKSYSNANFEFFENLYKKHFAHAKDKSQISSKPPTSSQLNFDKSEKDLFNLTSKTNTQLGISQFKNSQLNSIESFGKSQDKKSILRASSLNDKRQNQRDTIKSTMSINFKNSLYKKINPSTALLDDNSLSKIDSKSKILQDRSLQRKVMQSFNLDSSEESSDQEEIKQNKDSDRQPINLKNHIQNNKIQVLGDAINNKKMRRDHQVSKDSLEDAIFKSDFNVLSRRDLSARQDDNNIFSDNPSQIMETSNERRNKFHRGNFNADQDKSWSRNRNEIPNQCDDSSSSLNLFHKLLSSNHNKKMPKITSGQSSVLLSNPDFNLMSHYNNGDTQIIFEQPTKEDALEDTYKSAQPFNNNKQDFLGLKAEDLTTIVENNNQPSQNESSQMSQSNEILNTYKQNIMMARTNIRNEEPHNNHRKNFNSHKNSINIQQPLQDKYMHQQQSANPDRQRHVIGQSVRNSNVKDMNMNVDQKSDFTFILSNPTDFCECCAPEVINQNNSFVTQKFQKIPSTAQNSELKQQNQVLSSYRKGAFQTITQPPRLQDFGASPIYSENGGLPGSQFYLNQQVCQNCGGCKGNAKKMGNTQHRLSYNQMHNQSIKEEESQDAEDEYYQNQNYIDSQIEENSSQNIQANYHPNDRVFEYQQQNIQNNNLENQIVSGEISLEDGNLNKMVLTKLSPKEEELRRLQTIISFSQEYMSKILQDNSVSINLKSQLAQIMGAISSVYHPTPLNNHIASNLTHIQSNYNNNHHMVSQQTTLQPTSIFLDNNMTISELHQIQRQNQNNLMKKHNNQKNRNNEIIHEEVSTQQDKSVDSERYIKQKKDKTKHKKQDLNVPQNLKKKYQNLKSSLLSSSCEDPQFNCIREDTILSYIDQDDDEDFSDDDSLERQDKRIRIAAFKTLRQSEFNKSKSQYQNTAKKLKQSTQAHHKVNEIKKSLKQTKKSLLSTKQQLKRERLANQQQEDKMKKLEAQIEALTERWKMTEDSVKAKENMNQLMQRINSSTTTSTNLPNNSTHVGASASISLQQNTSISQKMAHNSSSSFIRRDLSPNINNQVSLNNNNSQSTKNFAGGSVSHINISQNHSHLDQSSKHLLEINDRLTKQIEDNLQLFENLNEELTNKDRAIAENQQKLQDKQREIDLLMKRLNEMSESMKTLQDITKSTSQMSEQTKTKHQEEMEQIKRKQQDYNQKLDRINSVFQNIPNTQSIISSNNDLNMYSKYQRRQVLGASNMLNCIPLTSPDSNGINMPTNQSNNSSRIQDEEFSIGQFNAPKQTENDMLPQKLSQINKQLKNEGNKENLRNREDGNSLLNSNVLNSLYNNLKESVKNYNNVQNTTQNHTNNFLNNTTESTMLKYSQDATHSLINTMKVQNN